LVEGVVDNVSQENGKALALMKERVLQDTLNLPVDIILVLGTDLLQFNCLHIHRAPRS
jgi:hypothetical protein